MKIKDLKVIDCGATGIEIEGKIIHVLKPRSGNYGWSQFIVVNDETGDQGCNVGVQDEDSGYKIGQRVSVKGKVGEWYKDKKGLKKRSIEGSVVDEVIERGYEEEEAEEKDKEESVNYKQKKPEVDAAVWEAKDLRYARESALKNAALFVSVGIIKLEDRLGYAQEDVDFIYNGLDMTNDQRVEMLGGAIVEIPEEGEPIVVSGVTGKTKAQLIAEAKALVKPKSTKSTPGMALASEAQLKMMEKMVKSKFITPGELKQMGELETLTKVKASQYITFWFGVGDQLGERDKREQRAKAEAQPTNPFKKKDQLILKETGQPRGTNQDRELDPQDETDDCPF